MKNCTAFCPYKNKNYCPVHQDYKVPVKKEVNKVSEKKKDLDKQYKKIRAKYLREHPMCEAKIEGCGKVAVEIHHKRGKVGEEDYLNPEFFLATCSHCHKIIEVNPAWAKQQGFSLSRLSKRA